MFSIGTALRETGQVLDRIGCSMQGSNAFREAISKHRTIMGIYEKVPALPRAGFIAPSASVIGDVTIGEKSSVWYGAVLRGDVNSIRIGAQTNIQDNTVIHVAKTNVASANVRVEEARAALKAAEDRSLELEQRLVDAERQLRVERRDKEERLEVAAKLQAEREDAAAHATRENWKKI